MPKIIQFMHPGRQLNLKEWNNEKDHKSHSSKFLLSGGQYFDSNNNALIRSESLYFWGEYEPQSEVSEIRRNATGGMPQSLHRPHYPGEMPAKAATTDPFVFGDGFKYTWCMQRTFKILRNLTPGDMILFGSRRGNGSYPNPYLFGVDTVFVVGNDQKYAMLNGPDLSKFKNEDDCYKKAVCNPMFQHWKEDRESWNNNYQGEFSFYKGATWNDRQNDMFSFVPARIGNESFAKFPLPDEVYSTIKIRAGESNEKNSARKSVGIACFETDVATIQEVWTLIINKLPDAGLVAGVQFDLPGKANSARKPLV